MTKYPLLALPKIITNQLPKPHVLSVILMKKKAKLLSKLTKQLQVRNSV